jgi:uncharacterized protein (DUF2147 family)
MVSSSRLTMAALAMMLALAAAPAAQTEPTDMTSPVGLWRTIDDKTGKPRGVIRVYEQDGKLFGKIERSLRPGEPPKFCDKCTDERKDQPLLGMIILRNLKRVDNEYRDGDILDPDNGSVYRCKMHLEDGGRKLVVRGFVGLSLFGRTQTWERE